MNFIVSKKVFYNALTIVAGAVSHNSPLPSLTGIKIDVKDNELILTGSDSNISIQTRLSNDNNEQLNLIVNEVGSIVIESRYIMEIVRKIESSEITIEIVDGSLTKISGDHAEFNINGIRSSDYPLIDFTVCEQSFTLPSKTLVDIINQTTFATSDKETRPALTGVNFKASGNELKCIATDSYRLALKTVTLDTPNTFNITIPAKSLNEVLKSLNEEKDIQVAVSNKKAQFFIDTTIIQTRLINEDYPDAERLILKDFNRFLEVDGYELLKAIDRASFIKNEGISIIKLTASPEEVIISSRSQEVGSSEELLDGAIYQGEPIELSFSGRYVIEALRALGNARVKINFSGEMKQFIINSLVDESIIQLVLPVRSYN